MIDRKKLRCYNCNKIGHFSFECNAPAQGNHHDGHRGDEANLLKDDGDLDEDPPVMMMMTTNSDSSSSRTWYLDSGCSNHMTGHTNWLVNFDDSKRSVIRLANNRTIAAQGMGDVLISKKDGSNALLSDVLFDHNFS